MLVALPRLSSILLLKIFLSERRVWVGWPLRASSCATRIPWKGAVGIFQDQVKDVLGSDRAEHLEVALNEIVHVKPRDFKLYLLTGGGGSCYDLFWPKIRRGLFEGFYSLLGLLNLRHRVVRRLAGKRWAASWRRLTGWACWLLRGHDFIVHFWFNLHTLLG